MSDQYDLSLCMFPGFILCFWTENWVKTQPKNVPVFLEFSADHVCHAYASVTHTRRLTIFLSTRVRQARARVICANSNPHVRVKYAYASL